MSERPTVDDYLITHFRAHHAIILDMALLEIVTPESNETILRSPAEQVTNVQDAAIQQLIDDMIETLEDAEGVGLAAPQIGRNLQLAIVHTLPDYDDEGEPIDGTRDMYVIVNPKIVWDSRKTTYGIEGCLSIPGYLGEVERNFAIRVTALDRNGRKKRYRLKGWDARIFQHEIDHLNGVLYTDKLTEPENYWTEEEYEAMREAEEKEREAEEAAAAA